MLQAKKKSGEMVTLATLAKQEIESLRNELFFCPVCQEKVIIKAGTQIIPHYAHLNNSSCPTSEGGEGPYHEQGKLLLYQWLQRQRFNVKLEAFIPEINQRPDLLLEIKGKKLAIEFQCARVRKREILQRNQGYARMGMKAIWILGASRFKRKGSYNLQVDRFSSQFIHQFHSQFPPTLYYFCPKTEKMLIVQDIYFTKRKIAIAHFSVHSLPKLNFSKLFHKQVFPEQALFQLWKKEKLLFRQNIPERLFRNDLAWYQWLYLKRTTKDYLPSIIYLPVQGQFMMKSPLWDWQSRICLEILFPLPVGCKFSIFDCYTLLDSHIDSPKQFPLVFSPPNPIKSYLSLLIHLGYLKKISEVEFEKQKEIHFFTHIEEAMKGDVQVIDQLLSLASK